MIEESTLKKVAENEDAAKAAELQRQLVAQEEGSLAEQKAALQKQQKFELALLQASNKVRQRSSLLKAVITAFPSVSLPFLAVPLLSQRTVAIKRSRS
eukprot:SAG22_NODE_123_length_18914_cov_28.993410_12_plen_98_part_00